MIAPAKRTAFSSVFRPRPPVWAGFALVAGGRTVARLAHGCPQALVRRGRGWSYSPILADYSAARLWAEERVAKRIRKQLAVE